MPQIEKEYIETGKMKHVFMDFPLPMHAQAMKASEATLCAGDQGKFLEMHDRLFANQNALSSEALSKHAEGIKAQMAEGQKAGVTGTPAFLLGFIESDGKVKATKKISGAVPFANFKATIDEMLSSKK